MPARRPRQRHGDIDFAQAGDRWRRHTEVEKTDLVNNLSDALGGAHKSVQDKMVELFTKCDASYGQRVREGIDKEMAKKASMNGHGHAEVGVKSAGTQKPAMA